MRVARGEKIGQLPCSGSLSCRPLTPSTMARRLDVREAGKASRLSSPGSENPKSFSACYVRKLRWELDNVQATEPGRTVDP